MCWSRITADKMFIKKEIHICRERGGGVCRLKYHDRNINWCNVWFLSSESDICYVWNVRIS